MVTETAVLDRADGRQGSGSPEGHRLARIHQESAHRWRPGGVLHRADDARVPGEGSVARPGARRGFGAARRHGGRGRHDGERPRSRVCRSRTRAGRWRQEHHRGRRRQGRRRKDDGCREPGDRAGEMRQPRRDYRRRHLRPERADHARHQARSSRPTARRSCRRRSTGFRSSRWGS